MSAPFVASWLRGLVAFAAIAGVAFAAQPAAEPPAQDAIVLQQYDKWSLEDDGTMIHEESRLVVLLNDRAWGRYSDPRIDYLEGSETVELLTGQARLPDETTLPIPEYSVNIVSPGATANWPVTAGWRQVVYSFSGVQNGAVLEISTRRTSKPGTRRWLTERLRLSGEDPVGKRIIEISVPKGQEVKNSLGGCAPRGARCQENPENGRMECLWTLGNIPPVPDEAGGEPWDQRGARFAFTNCPSVEAWLSDLLDNVEQSAISGEGVKKLVEDAGKDEVDDEGRLRATMKKLQATFATVADWRGWIGRKTRPAEEALATSHGTLVESAAVTLAAARSLNLTARPLVAVERRVFRDTMPVDADLETIVIEVTGAGDGPVYIEAGGQMIYPGSVTWRSRDLLALKEGAVERIALGAPAETPDAVLVRAQLKLDDKAENLTGSAGVELSGAFMDAESLRDETQKRSKCESVLGQTVSGLTVSDLSVSRFLPGRLEAKATLATKAAAKRINGLPTFVLGEQPPGLAMLSLPVARSDRRTAVRVSVPVQDEMSLKIDLPSGWKPAVLPESLPAVSGKWGRLEQTVELDDDGDLVVSRTVQFKGEPIPAEDFEAVRVAVRALQGEACRTLVLEEAKQ